MQEAIRFSGVTRNLGSTRALNDLSFSIPAGSVAGLIGNNGAGKTTTFSMIARYLRLTRGEIFLFGMPLASFYHSGRYIGLLPQDAEFFDDVPIQRQLLFLAALIGLRGKAGREEVDRVLDQCGLLEKAGSYPHALSRGMKMRLGIAQALLGSPDLLLFDEPTAGLDPGMQLQFRELIQSVRQSATVVISSHDLAGLEQLCTYVCFIENGHLVREEPLGTLQNEIGCITYELSSHLYDLTPLSEVLPGGRLTQLTGSSFSVHFDPAQYSLTEVNRRMLSWLLEKRIAILSVRPESSLERLFVKP